MGKRTGREHHSCTCVWEGRARVWGEVPGASGGQTPQTQREAGVLKGPQARDHCPGPWQQSGPLSLLVNMFTDTTRRSSGGRQAWKENHQARKTHNLSGALGPRKSSRNKGLMLPGGGTTIACPCTQTDTLTRAHAHPPTCAHGHTSTHTRTRVLHPHAHTSSPTSLSACTHERHVTHSHRGTCARMHTLTHKWTRVGPACWKPDVEWS